MLATIGRNGEVTLPAEVRAAAHLDEGDEVEVELTEDGILLRVREDEDEDDLPDPSYYESPEWQAGLKRALEDVEAGRTTFYASDEEFLAALDEWSKDADVRDK